MKKIIAALHKIIRHYSQQRDLENKYVVLWRLWSHDLGSLRTLVTLLRPWIRRFTIIIPAWWLRTSSKFSEPEQFEDIYVNIASLESLLNRCGFFQSRSSYLNEKVNKFSNSLTLSGDRIINMHYSNNNTAGTNHNFVLTCIMVN